MGVKIYISGLSGNKEVKKRQQRVTMILDSKHIPYELIDITEPGKEDEKEFMQENARVLEGSKYALPPQIFMDSEYCGDYEQFDLSNENDELEKFLKLSDEEIQRIKAMSTPRASPMKESVEMSNGVASKEVSVEKEIEFERKDVDGNEKEPFHSDPPETSEIASDETNPVHEDVKSYDEPRAEADDGEVVVDPTNQVPTADDQAESEEEEDGDKEENA